MVHYSQHQIAAGWNNTGDYDYIGELVADGVQFSEPVQANHGFNPGKYIVRLDQLTSLVGKNKQIFIMSMTFAQYKKVQADYCGGGNSGKVTVHTRWTDNTWDDYNAYLELQGEGLEAAWGGYKNVQWTYKDLRVIP